MSIYCPNCNACIMRPKCGLYKLYEEYRVALNTIDIEEQNETMRRIVRLVGELEKKLMLQAPPSLIEPKNGEGKKG